MSTRRDEVTGARPLDILGISEQEEGIYRWLLMHPDASLPEIAQALVLTSGKAQRLLGAIETKGLVTHAPERPRRYIPASPDIALRALVRRRQESLQRAETVIQTLQEGAAAYGNGKQEQVVELVTNHEAQRQIFEQMPVTAQEEIIALVRAPLLVSRLDGSPDEDHPTQRDSIARGVRFRSIVDSEFLGLPGALRSTREDIKAGEEVRTIDHLPFKMVLADRRLAIVPLDLQRQEGPLLLVRTSALLDALYSLFELLWRHSAPVSFNGTSRIESEESQAQLLTEEVKDLISLLVSGLNDKSIASEMNISRRTQQRHVTDLMQILHARTRFQAGWLAALSMVGAAGVDVVGAIAGIQKRPS